MGNNLKKKMQDVSFRNIEEFLEFLPGDELKMTVLLRNLIFNCLPNAGEKLSYNVPFYKHHKNFCFIWPSSVIWGKKRTWEGVRLGFTNGWLIEDDINYLDRGERKQVYWKDYRRIAEIDVELVKSYIFQAILIDEQLKKKPRENEDE